jgi:hypothetical protein
MSSYLKKLSKVVPNNYEKFLIFNKEIDNIKRDLKNYLKNIKKINLSILKRQHLRIKLKEEWPQWKKGLINLIGMWGLFEKRDLPEYILKSGLRSFYFFDLSRLLYDPQIRKDFIRYLEEGIRYSLKQLEDEGIDTSSILLVNKTYGEEPGTVALSSLLLEQRYTDIQLMPIVPWFDRIRGLTLEEGQVYRPILLDTLTTTGGTLREILKRLEKMGYKLGAYIVIVDRSPKGLQYTEEAKKLRIFSLISLSDLLEAGILEPEVLLGDVDLPIYLSLDLNRDTIYEVCEFYQKEDEYKSIRTRFHELVDRAFCINGSKIYGIFDLSREIEAFKEIIINILILSYNSLKKRAPPIISKLTGIEYLKYIEEVERFSSPILNQISDLLRNKLIESFTAKFEDKKNIKIHDIIDVFATHNLVISKYICNECLKFINMEPKEKYTEEELRKLVEIGMRLLEESDRRRLGSSYTPSPEERRERFERLYKIYKLSNELFGRPPDEKFLGEKFFEGLLNPPKHRERSYDK